MTRSSSHIGLARSVVLWGALGGAGLAQAAIVEDVIDVPVQVSNMYGREFAQTIKVTVFHDTDRARSPYLVLHHGRPTSAAEMAKVPRFRYSQASRYFVSLGFTVLVPTRVGYGESGGPDVEDSGHCEARAYEPAYAAAAAQTLAAVAAARQLPHVDTTRGIVVGQSFGGATAIALAASELPGLQGAVNFAGGGGGNPDTRPERPCSPHKMKALFAHHGARAHVPTLWLYSVNDRFWGPDLPRDWFEAFRAQGGSGQFVALPPYQDNGHGIFTGNPAAWQPAFEAFVRSLGFTAPTPLQALP